MGGMEGPEKGCQGWAVSSVLAGGSGSVRQRVPAQRVLSDVD